MPQTQPSPKPINNNSSRAFANDNFCGINHPPLEGGSNGIAVWGGVNFLNVSPQKISLNKPSSAQKASQAFNLKASSQAFNLKVSSQAFNLKTPSQAFNSKAPSDFNSNASQAFNSKASRAFNQRASLNNPHSFLNPSPAFKHFKISPSSAQNESPQETSLKKPSSALNASLFLFKQKLEQKQLAPGVASFRLRSFLTPFWLKTSHWLVFLTPEPNHDPQTLFNPIEEQQKQWADNSRGITPAASALIAVAIIVVACVLTACTAAPAAGAAGAGTGAAAGAAAGGTAAAGAGAAGAGAGAAAGTTAAAATTATAATAAGISTATAVGTVVATTAASTFTISAVNASMNADGDAFKQAGDIGKTATKDSTSKDALKSYAIAGATALLTMGITTGIDFLANGAANTANAANGVANGAANTANAANGAANSTSSISSLGNTTLTTGLTTAFKETAIRTIANTTAQSAINGDSFSEGLKNSGKNLIINTIAQVAAQNIGELAHPSNGTEGVGQPLQLTLHAGLGCATGAALNGSGGCGAGAAAGVIGELTGAALKGQVDSGEMTKSTATQIAGLAGAAGAMFATTNDDKVSDNMFTGQNVGGNAAANNALLFAGKYPIPFTDSIKTSDDKDYDLHFGVQGSLTHNSASFGTDGFGLEADLNPTVGVGGYFNILPHGDQAAYSIITGIKNSELGSGGIIVTRQGNLGLTGSYGIAFPLYPAITNVSIPIPLDKLKNK